MKRIIFLTTVLTVLMFMAPPAQAQEYYAGVIGGMNNAAFTLDDYGVDRDVSTRHLLAVGGVFGLSLNKNFSIQLEPMVLQKGGIISDNTPRLFLKSTYLELPVLLKVGIVSLNKKEQAYLMAGPTLGLLLSSELTGESNGITFKGDMKDVQRNVDFGFALGGGIGFGLGRGSLFLEARYNFGFTDINKGGVVEFSAYDITITEEIRGEDKMSNKGFQLLVGYTLPLGKKKSF